LIPVEVSDTKNGVSGGISGINTLPDGARSASCWLGSEEPYKLIVFDEEFQIALMPF
jgi:hypothetical protein